MITEYGRKFHRRFGYERSTIKGIPHVWESDKNKPKAIFIGKTGWFLTPNQAYEIIKTELIWNDDKDVKEHYKNNGKYDFHSGHKMDYYIKIINDLGHKRYYPQTLFKFEGAKD